MSLTAGYVSLAMRRDDSFGINSALELIRIFMTYSADCVSNLTSDIIVRNDPSQLENIHDRRVLEIMCVEIVTQRSTKRSMI